MTGTTLEAVVVRVRTHLAALAGDPGRPLPAVASWAERALRPAAVCVVLFAEDERGEASFVLVRRAMRGRNAGQWALPGGKVEDGESLRVAALREASEEVGLDPATAEVLGVLDDLPTASGFRITPHVVVAPPGWRPVADAVEVRSVHTFTVARLLEDDVVRWVESGDGADGGRVLQMRLSHHDRVHAPTGAMLLQLRGAVQGRYEPVAHLTQPRFTHT